MTDDALSYFKLNETAAGPVVDTQGLQNGTNVGATINQTGKFSSKCYAFDGSDDEITVADNVAYHFGTGSFSISMWIKCTSTSTTGNQFFLVKYAGGSNLICLGIYNPTGYLWGRVRDGSGGHEVYVQVNINFVDGLWHHIAFVFNTTTKAVKYYYDGYNDTGTDGDCTGFGTLNENVGSWKIGGWDGNGYFTGMIDEFRIYNRVLSQAEINGLYYDNQLTYTDMTTLQAFNDYLILVCKAMGQSYTATGSPATTLAAAVIINANLAHICAALGQTAEGLISSAANVQTEMLNTCKYLKSIAKAVGQA